MYRKAKLGKTWHIVREGAGGGLFSVLASNGEKELDNVLGHVQHAAEKDGYVGAAEEGYTMVAVGKSRRWLARNTIGTGDVRGVGWCDDEDELRVLLKSIGVELS